MSRSHSAIQRREDCCIQWVGVAIAASHSENLCRTAAPVMPRHQPMESQDIPESLAVATSLGS